MRYLLGLIFFILALSLLSRARAYRAAALAGDDPAAFARRRAAMPRTPGSLAALGERARPFVMFALFYVAIKTTLAFVAFEGTRSLSWFDLAGFLALLAGYGAWFAVRTHYWLPDAHAARELERALEAHIASGEGGKPGDDGDTRTPTASRSRSTALRTGSPR